ncbi:uncharacterized protein CLUP02_03562 [Colletotrichum lupini]|uniref:Secreted protein n=1 Tax=Colletotrichum lupini TaxID=145971 RepID=A0A9Q8SJ24_9PEZI|nr:uncharacterized protein CLUP02_03562 [Colletotrichum lupini]UQC78088.1 hypothetical protein CLUP02_03562 [Colletotrichum lupini]
MPNGRKMYPIITIRHAFFHLLAIVDSSALTGLISPNVAPARTKKVTNERGRRHTVRNWTAWPRNEHLAGLDKHAWRHHGPRLWPDSRLRNTQVTARWISFVFLLATRAFAAASGMSDGAKHYLITELIRWSKLKYSRTQHYYIDNSIYLKIRGQTYGCPAFIPVKLAARGGGVISNAGDDPSYSPASSVVLRIHHPIRIAADHRKKQNTCKTL